MDAKRFFTDIKLVPVVTLEHHENAVDLALCLRDAGIRAIEVTLRTEAALKAIELIADAVPDISVGAGSVRSTEQITAIRERGAKFAVSPGHSRSLFSQIKGVGMPFGGKNQLQGCGLTQFELSEHNIPLGHHMIT